MNYSHEFSATVDEPDYSDHGSTDGNKPQCYWDGWWSPLAQFDEERWRATVGTLRPFLPQEIYVAVHDRGQLLSGMPTLEAWLEAGGDANAHRINGSTALHTACIFGAPSPFVELLLSRGANADQQDVRCASTHIPSGAPL